MIEIILMWIGITLGLVVAISIGGVGAVLLCVGIVDDYKDIMGKIFHIVLGLFILVAVAGAVLLVLHENGVV